MTGNKASRKKVFFALAIILAIAALLLLPNYLMLQCPMNLVVREDYRNKGITVWPRFGGLVNPRILVYDLRSVSPEKSKADVFRVFLQFAKRMRDREFSRVYLSYKGNLKFYLDGSYFKRLGNEYDWQNPVYIIRTFPEYVKELDGSTAYQTWMGGFLGVSLEQFSDFDDFHDRWYVSDMN